MLNSIKAVKILVHGKVQGVFYRKKTQQKAKELNVQGWVKNNTDGTVEIFVQGPELEVLQMIEWCKQGPKNAAVSQLDTQDSTPENYSDFNILR